MECVDYKRIWDLGLFFDNWIYNWILDLMYLVENVSFWIEVGFGFMFIILYINYNYVG